MGLLHFQNIPINNSKQDIFKYIEELEQLCNLWVNPIFKFDRLIFSVPGAVRHFLMKLPGTIWGKMNFLSEQKPCSEECHETLFEQEKLQFESIEIQQFPIFRCNPALMFQLSPLFELFPLDDIGSRILRFELLGDESNESKEDLKMLLQDFWVEWKIKDPPRCSFIHKEYEVNLGQDPNTLKRQTRRTRRPPATYQRWLQKIAPQWYPASIGNEYYGKKAFLFFLPYIMNNISHIGKYFPPAPMKYYDFALSEQIEIRFDEWIPKSRFFEWLKKLNEIQDVFPNSLIMMRVKIAYDAWDSGIDHKSAGQDEFWFTWNDVEFGFKHQNLDLLKNFINNIENSKLLSFYFNLTPKIEDIDFRIKALEGLFHNSVHMR